MAWDAGTIGINWNCPWKIQMQCHPKCKHSCNIPPLGLPETLTVYKKSTSTIYLDYYNVPSSVHLFIQNA